MSTPPRKKRGHAGKLHGIVFTFALYILFRIMAIVFK